MPSLKKILVRVYLYLHKQVEQARARKALRKWTPRDRKMLGFYASFLSPDALCFDIGANVGNRTGVFLKLPARVVAVEPQTECLKTLKALYGRNPRLTIVPAAIGAAEGQAEMRISNSTTISSLSPEWIESVKKSGRFAQYRWDEKQIVPVTTLDKLIEKHGTPDFVKIDVEGFEYQVLSGLSRPVRMLSLEFTPEFLESTYKCIDHLARLGDIRLNYALGEEMTFALEEWVSPREIVPILASFENKTDIFGDLYVRFPASE